jgi:uncharacterized membrane protein YbhN (UPF0104 family)
VISGAGRRGRMRVARLLGPGVAIAALALVFATIPFALVRHALSTARPVYVGAALVVALVVQLVDAARFRRWTDMHGLDLSVWQLLRINLATQFYGLAFPGGSVSGMAIRCAQLPGGTKLATGVSFLADQAVLTLAMGAVGAACWIAAHPGAGLPAIGALIVLAGGGVLARSPVRALAAAPVVRRISDRLRRGVPARADGRWTPEVRRRFLVQIGALAVLSNVLRVLVYFCLAQALGLGLSLVTIGWIRSLMMVATMPPVTVSGLGLREGAALLLLSRYGIAAERIVAFSLAVFGVALVFGLLGGVVEAVRLGRSARLRPGRSFAGVKATSA